MKRLVLLAMVVAGCSGPAASEPTAATMPVPSSAPATSAAPAELPRPSQSCRTKGGNGITFTECGVDLDQWDDEPADEGPEYVVLRVTTTGEATVAWADEDGTETLTITEDWIKRIETADAWDDHYSVAVVLNGRGKVSCAIVRDGDTDVEKKGSGRGATAMCNS